MNRFTLLTSIVIVIVIAAGCQQKSSEVAPPNIQYGQTPCEGCGMIVSDQRFAAALIIETPDGERRPAAFDDIGCMLDYEREHHDGKVLGRFVKDVTTAQWIAADKATFARGKSIASPMASGIAAAATPQAAEKFAADNNASAIQTFAQLNQAAPASASQAAAQ